MAVYDEWEAANKKMAALSYDAVACRDCAADVTLIETASGVYPTTRHARGSPEFKRSGGFGVRLK